MCIYTGVSIIMRDIQHITISEGRHTYATDIAIGHGIHLLAFHTLRLDVETRMDVIGANLTESGGEIDGDVERAPILGEGRLSPKACSNKREQNSKK